MHRYFLILGLGFYVANCGSNTSAPKDDKTSKPPTYEGYSGSASISQGLAKITHERIFECAGGRKTDMGLITSNDGKQWVMPAKNNFTNSDIPFAPDLFNSCTDMEHANIQEALSKLGGSDIVEIDPDGLLFTAYIFADNYFEMYINGAPVGKDRVPFTPFNSSIVKFKVRKPFTVAMRLIDWEENLGLGSEKNRNSNYHAGDGGMVAVIKDEDQQIVAVTNEHWKAQTFYTAPVKDLACASEVGMIRLSTDCDDKDSDDGESYFALHWPLPLDWEKKNFDDSNWPHATTYTNETIGVDNKKAYTNFADIFDEIGNDAKFIWSTNVVLDNEVLVRYTVK